MLLKMQEMEHNPAIVEAAGQSVVNDTQEALFFTSRPEMKFILGVNYDIGKFGFNFNNTYFGKTKFAHKVYKI
jgi:iron complex outermembrane receptor protein